MSSAPDAPPTRAHADGLAIDFVVESDRAHLSDIVQRVRDGRLRTNVGNIATLDDAVGALNHPRSPVRTRRRDRRAADREFGAPPAASRPGVVPHTLWLLCCPEPP